MPGNINDDSTPTPTDKIRDQMPHQEVVPPENRKTAAQRWEDLMDLMQALGEMVSAARRCWIAAQRCWVLVNVLIDDKLKTPQVVDGGGNGNGTDAATDT
ncbi:hypothetical protein K435DRAFT_864882 [Dendrothele bispora CBS 962.96]|uniref:Uncharacterized protein n=1 Tax=Dendrothele bispora (strain CBS 962.96) TaxID=1314807 RepID=A0A4S8LKU2_DENBC|nr:hypothetical protein K435DRAFT_864882 [Dendrothele bispora CBS 962.96]